MVAVSVADPLAEQVSEPVPKTDAASVATYYKAKTKNSKPRAVHPWSWTVADTQKWFRRHCSEYVNYIKLFESHDITGRALLRLTDNSLLRMGIVDNKHREGIWREILKQKLKASIMEIKDLEYMNMPYE